jgi:hypothetical protein
MRATAEFLDWAAQHGIVWQTTRRGADEVWVARVEFYQPIPAGADPESGRRVGVLTAS